MTKIMTLFRTIFVIFSKLLIEVALFMVFFGVRSKKSKIIVVTMPAW